MVMEKRWVEEVMEGGKKEGCEIGSYNRCRYEINGNEIGGLWMWWS